MNVTNRSRTFQLLARNTGQPGLPNVNWTVTFNVTNISKQDDPSYPISLNASLLGPLNATVHARLNSTLLHNQTLALALWHDFPSPELGFATWTTWSVTATATNGRTSASPANLSVTL